jgi:hypothetical protein
MGKVILGLAAPHNPNITSRPEKMSHEVQSKLDSAFGYLKGRLSEASPDCLLVLTSDHVTNFFYNNAPMFCLGVSDTCTGPAPKELSELRIPRATLKVDTAMAKGLLHFGQQIGEYIRNHYNGNVAVLASGSFTGDIGGPKMGSIDTALDLEFLDLVKNAKGQEMVNKATTETLERAGVANEILIWIALQGVLGDLRPSFTDYICGKDWSTAATLAAWQPNVR